MHDRIKRSVDMQVITDVVFDETESIVPHHMRNVFRASRDEIVQTPNLVPLLNEELA
jgi:hypothetical protein